MTTGRFLRVRHQTVYRYSQPVALGEHRMMFRPREGHDLRLVEVGLSILPTPTRIRWLHDVFDNSVAIATFGAAPILELRFDSSLALEHLERTPLDYALEPGAYRYPFKYVDDDGPDLRIALMQHYPAAEVGLWATRFLTSSAASDTMDLLERMTNAIREDFRYVQRFEKGVQNPGETLRLRSGSCRDFAVLMMEAVRSLGIAARFVSGYIFLPELDPGEHRTGTTHAWLQVYLPGAGWVDFDPTNSIIGNRNLIPVAVAWNQRQALPLWGTFVGPRDACVGMDVSVDVTEQQAGAEAAVHNRTAAIAANL